MVMSYKRHAFGDTHSSRGIQGLGCLGWQHRRVCLLEGQSWKFGPWDITSVANLTLHIPEKCTSQTRRSFRVTPKSPKQSFVFVTRR